MRFARNRPNQTALSLAACLLTLLTLPSPEVLAAEATESPRFSITRFGIDGTLLLNADEVDRALQPFTGPDRTFSDLQRARAALLALYAARGYTTIDVVLPPQDITDGVVVFQVMESSLGTVAVVNAGQRSRSERNATRPLVRLKPGVPPDVRALDRALELANENPAKYTTVLLKRAAEPHTVDAEVQVDATDPLDFFVALDNTGTDETGDLRMSLGVRHANLFDRDQIFTFQYVTAPYDSDDPDEFRPLPNDRVKIFGASYRIPLYSWGGMVDLVGGYSSVDSGRVQNLFDVSGSGKQAGARYIQLLPRVGNWSQRVSAGFDWRAFDSRVMPLGADLNLTPSVTVRPLSLGYAGSWNDGSGWAAGLTTVLSHNVPGGADGGDADFAAARAGADAAYLLLRWNAGVQVPLPAAARLHMSTRGQWTPDALVAGEQFGAGGVASVRGFFEREIADDQGVSGTLEVESQNLGPRIHLGSVDTRVLGFYDWAALWRNEALPGEDDRQTIASLGIGLRLSHHSGVSLSVEHGWVIESGGTRDSGDGRAHVLLAWTF